jgi:cytochrome c oxidase subunit 3
MEQVLEKHHEVEEKHAGLEGAKMGMWLFLFTELLLFGGLFAAYAVFHTIYAKDFEIAHHHLNRTIGFINTLILIASSFTMALSVRSAQTSRKGLLNLFLLLTILLGTAFLVIKLVFEWPVKFAEGLYPGGKEFNHLLQEGHRGQALFFSLYFMLTGLHGLHVLVGVLVLLGILFMALRNTFSSEYYGPVEVSGLYWHLVDLIWIYLFPLFYLIK